MNSDQQKKFAELIFNECNKQTPAYIKRTNDGETTSLKRELSIMVAGVFALLVPCILLFDGNMIPAMWQLTSVFWLFWRILKFKL